MDNYNQSELKHECCEWDGLEIDERDIEFIVCECYTMTEEIKEIKIKLRKQFELEKIQNYDRL